MTHSSFPVIDINDWNVLSTEEMGSKPKFWFREPKGPKWLFKLRHRPKVGDDWAEKIAGEIAELLLIPHATVELAKFHGGAGIISKDLVGSDDQRELVLGNNLLVEGDPAYPHANRYHVAEHTLERVFTAVDEEYIGLPDGCPRNSAITSPLDLFVGFLMLDALIGNTDRHHENWAILQLAPEGKRRRAVLCPSFDHASSLGHLLTDEERERRLTTRDQGYTVDAYVRRGRSAFYRSAGDGKPMSLLEGFFEGANRRPNAGEFWRGQLNHLDASILDGVISRIPSGLMTEPARQFAVTLMTCNRTRLLAGTI